MPNQALEGRPQPGQAKSGEPIIAVDRLRKRFGKTVAVNGVSFSVLPGETLGLLGPNGAGKTTTMKILSGLTRPDDGDVMVDGYSIRRATQQVQRCLGVVPQGLALYDDMTARANLEYFARLRGLSRSERKSQIAEILHLVGLEADAGRRAGGFSGGMKRRLNIGIGLLGKPKVLLLDEPTVGIDPQSRRHILESVRRLADGGMTIIYTSHYMEEVEYLCRRVAIMDHGRVIAQGPIDEVRALAGDSVVLRVPLAVSPTRPMDPERLREAFAVPLELRSDGLHFALPNGSSQVPAVLNTLVAMEIPLDGMTVESPNLETVFLALTGKALRDHDAAEALAAGGARAGGRNA